MLKVLKSNAYYFSCKVLTFKSIYVLVDGSRPLLRVNPSWMSGPDSIGSNHWLSRYSNLLALKE